MKLIFLSLIAFIFLACNDSGETTTTVDSTVQQDKTIVDTSGISGGSSSKDTASYDRMSNKLTDSTKQ